MSDTPANSEARTRLVASRAEVIAWRCAGAALVGFLLTLVILLTDQADYDGPPAVTLAFMALALTAVAASAIPATILTGARQIAEQYRNSQ